LTTINIDEGTYKKLLQLKAEAQKRLSFVVSLNWLVTFIVDEFLAKIYDSEGLEISE
jgi:hypothetical protein